MKIKKVTLTNFRNYASESVDFCDGFNLVSGPNGQGKTNLAEAICFASLAKSPRTHHDEELVRDGSNEASVSIEIEKDFGKQTVSYSLGENKQFFVNGNKISKLSELFGTLVTVYFSPNEMSIVSGSPEDRRDFMDTDISELSGNYYNLVQRYNKVLFQRNKLLKNTYDHKAILDQIDIWDEQLASVAAPIIRTRKNFIAKLLSPSQNAMHFLSKETEKLDIEYLGAEGNSTAEIKANILSGLKASLNKDMELGYTTIGPHRDDIKILLNGKDSKIYASQGQKRSIVLAIKVGELELFEKELGEKPVFVLDDVFSELDTGRQKKLYECAKDYQVIMTGTTFKFKPQTEFKQIKVKNGTAK
ncbi:MAG: DNA replication/repair protein RecF [Clostridia bacterium]|nr:DNA replication/repair protein RecF [Clostridia bacterium]